MKYLAVVLLLITCIGCNDDELETKTDIQDADAATNSRERMLADRQTGDLLPRKIFNEDRTRTTVIDIVAVGRL